MAHDYHVPNESVKGIKKWLTVLDVEKNQDRENRGGIISPVKGDIINTTVSVECLIFYVILIKFF